MFNQPWSAGWVGNDGQGHVQLVSGSHSVVGLHSTSPTLPFSTLRSRWDACHWGGRMLLPQGHVDAGHAVIVHACPHITSTETSCHTSCPLSHLSSFHLPICPSSSLPWQWKEFNNIDCQEAHIPLQHSCILLRIPSTCCTPAFVYIHCFSYAHAGVLFLAQPALPHILFCCLHWS